MNDKLPSGGPGQHQINGWINGFIGVLLFSGSMPATKVAVLGLLAPGVLLLFKEKRPARTQLFSLVIVVIGVVVGFPLLSALALKYITSAHSLVFIGMLPLTTAIFGVWRGGERPRPVFWVFSILGSLMVIGFAITLDRSVSPIGDVLMLFAIVLCGLGYAEGAKLSRTPGGWQVISWALVLSLPVMIPLVFLLFPSSVANVGAGVWIGSGCYFAS